MSSKKRTQAVATAITVAKPTGKAAAKQAVQASSKAATRPTQKSTQKSTAPVFEVHSQLGDDDDEDGAVESDAESQDDEFDEAMQRAAEDSDEGVSSRSSTRPVSAHDGSSSDDVDSEDADDSQDDVEFDTDEDDEAEFSDDDAEHDEESDEPEASEASAASKPISKKSEARTEAVRAAHTTMKRAHMGKAGRLLIRKSGDAPSGVNWAENSDSSEDEHENRIGNVPIEWYAEHDHIGYRVDGSKMTKKTQQDQLDRFLTSIDDPNAKRTVYDEINDRNVVISEEEMRIIQRMRHGKLPGKEFDAFAEFGDWFSSEKEIHPLGNVFEPKARFIPSKHEGRKIYKLVNAIRNGWIKLDEEEDLESAEAKEAKKAEALYLIWDGQAADRNRNAPPPITAPKPKLPGHAESYNPPAEYLPTEEELSAWENMDPEDRPLNFVPQQYDAMRKIPLYPDMLKERFERCLDLYLCPRARRKRLNIDPDSLLPQLPKPAELKPFPTSVAIEYKGHSAAVRTLSVSPTGQWLASGAADGEVRIWEVDTGRCVSRFTLPFCAGEDDDGISAVSFNPNADLPLLAVAAASKVLIYHTALGSDAQNAAAHELLSSAIPDASDEKQHARWSVGKNLKMHTTDAKKSAAETIVDEPIDVAENVPRCCAVIEIRKVVRKGGLSWHAKGDYLCSVSIENAASSVLIHRLSKRQTQTPFAKSKGTVQSVLFHPEKPFLFVATQQHVRVYNLVQQGLLKKLQCSVQRISSLALHPGGDNLIIGSEDRRVCWFDMDLSTKPYKTIKYHKGAVNGVSFHRTYPLFCSASSDGAVHVFHATVYSDLLQNPLVVPVKVLHAHSNGVLDCAFHPTQPWIFTAGNDQTLKLFH